jgi:RimJ/RimL family protein N-acetyltransferase
MRTVTQRLILEPVNERNAVQLWRVMQHAHLREFQDVPRLSREDFVRRVSKRPRAFDGHTMGRFEWLIVTKAGGRAVGWVSLRVGEGSPESAEMGYSILVDARSQGYGTEAARAIVDAAFSTELHAVDAACVPANAPSRRLLETIGFTQVRTQKNGAVVRGKPVDICVYRMTRDEWSAMREVTVRRRSGS